MKEKKDKKEIMKKEIMFTKEMYSPISEIYIEQRIKKSNDWLKVIMFSLSKLYDKNSSNNRISTKEIFLNTGVSMAQTYLICEYLQTKGFLKKIKKGKTVFYIVLKELGKFRKLVYDTWLAKK
jgi:hypothetical protein